MAYIYKISNDINHKVYIGKTEFEINKRWSEHCNDYLKRDYEKRPLYSAMRKYGIEHFHIELIEETDNPEEREIYWIDYYNSYRNGYNATRGGDGKRYLDYDAIVSKYQDTNSIAEVARRMQCSTDQVSKILKISNVCTSNNLAQSTTSSATAVIMIDKNTMQPIREFKSIHDAAVYVLPTEQHSTNLRGAAGHIANACSGKRKTAYGYCWKAKSKMAERKINNEKRVDQYDINDTYIQTFNSYSEAARYLIRNGVNLSVKQLVSLIGLVANGKRKSCYGYIWKNNLNTE